MRQISRPTKDYTSELTLLWMAISDFATSLPVEYHPSTSKFGYISLSVANYKAKKEKVRTLTMLQILSPSVYTMEASGHNTSRSQSWKTIGPKTEDKQREQKGERRDWTALLLLVEKGAIEQLSDGVANLEAVVYLHSATPLDSDHAPIHSWRIGRYGHINAIAGTMCGGWQMRLGTDGVIANIQDHREMELECEAAAGWHHWTSLLLRSSETRCLSFSLEAIRLFAESRILFLFGWSAESGAFKCEITQFFESESVLESRITTRLSWLSWCNRK